MSAFAYSLGNTINGKFRSPQPEIKKVNQIS